MENFDVLIVGGGPAGSSCAWQLCKRGLDVAVMDKAEFPRDKVCAGWITPAVVHALELDIFSYAQTHTLQRISSFRTGMIAGNHLETHYPTPVSYGIRRKEFDDYLLRRSGAHLKLGQPMDTIARNGDRWLVNGSISASMVVGAGGYFCPVARMLGSKQGIDEQAVRAQEIEFEMTPAQQQRCLVRGDTPELYFCEDMKGYGWCFRKGNFLNIGLGREDNRGLPQQLKFFCTFLKNRGRVPLDIPDKFHGHAYLLYGQSGRNLMDDGVLLIGDAAGLAYPQSGEGIRPSVESGLMAAATIVEASGIYNSRQLNSYSKRLHERFGSASSAKGRITSFKGGLGFLRKRIAEVLLGNRWFVRKVVLDHWFLHADIPDIKIEHLSSKVFS